jgi:aerobic carbon-monoxide dehydrogenase medium subunit
MKLPAFEYRNPATVAEALRVLADGQGAAKIIAGGQTLLPIMAFRLASPSVLVDLARVPGLDRIDIDEQGVTIGAMVRWRDIEADARLRTACPLLVAAVAHIGHYQIRNRGTVGGSLAHADPAAELPGIAVACDAQIEIVGPGGTRHVAARDFFLGALTTDLSHDEIITAVRLPPWPQRRRWAFDEFAPRRGDFAFAGVAVHFEQSDDGRVADAHVGVIGATSVPRRLAAVEQVINGSRLDETVVAAAGRAAAAAVDPDDDIHASTAYRRALVGTLVERTLVSAAQRAVSS